MAKYSIGCAAGIHRPLQRKRNMAQVRDKRGLREDWAGPHLSSNHSHGGCVSQGDLVGVVAANAHAVQVPEVGSLGHTAALQVGGDLLVHRLHELVADGVASLNGLTCKHSLTLQSRMNHTRMCNTNYQQGKDS